MKIFCKKIKELRQSYKYSQGQIAEKLYLSRQSYGRYENGTAEPSQETLIKIAEIFDVSVDYLLGRKEL